jgi:hypothetical protein
MRIKKRHRKVLVSLRGELISVDRAISKLILLLNTAGCITRNSCQGTCGGSCRVIHKRAIPADCQSRVWIVFDSTRSSQRFVDIIRRGSDSERRSDWIQGQGTVRSQAWRWRIFHDDYKQIVHLCLPRAHLLWVEERLEEYIRGIEDQESSDNASEILQKFYYRRTEILRIFRDFLVR